MRQCSAIQLAIMMTVFHVVMFSCRESSNIPVSKVAASLRILLVSQRSA